jgi:hypothetical protein
MTPSPALTVAHQDETKMSVAEISPAFSYLSHIETVC